MENSKDARNNAVIVITETASHYLVRIPASEGDRIRGFGGGQWDGKRKMWAFKKTAQIYDKLRDELKDTASVFAIHPPDPKAVDLPPEILDPEEEANDELSIDLDPEQSPEAPKLIPSHLQEFLNDLKSDFSEQRRALSELIELQQTTADQISDLALSASSEAETSKPEESLPDLLDLNKTQHLHLFEKALIGVGYFSSNQDRSFMSWVVRNKPLQMPSEFVQNTHELLKGQLEKITGNDDPRASFTKLLSEVKDKDLIYQDKDDPVKPIPILANLNAIRNQFAHPRQPMGYADRYARVILYLMNLSLVWNKIIIEDESVENTEH